MNVIGQRIDFEFLCSNHLLIFRCQNGSFAQPNMVFVIWTNTRKNCRNQFFFWLCELTKLDGNEMRSVEAPTGIFPLPMSNNCLENTFVDLSFCYATRLSFVNLRVFTYFYKFDDFKQVFISSAAVDLGMTGSFWRKSPVSRIIEPLKGFCLLRKSFNIRLSVSNARLCAI